MLFVLKFKLEILEIRLWSYIAVFTLPVILKRSGRNVEQKKDYTNETYPGGSLEVIIHIARSF